MNEFNLIAIGNYLKVSREEKGWSQKEVAEKLGISLEDVKVINRYELRHKKERAEKLAEKILYYPDFSMLFRFSNGAICFYDRKQKYSNV